MCGWTAGTAGQRCGGKTRHSPGGYSNCYSCNLCLESDNHFRLSGQTCGARFESAFFSQSIQAFPRSRDIVSRLDRGKNSFCDLWLISVRLLCRRRRPTSRLTSLSRKPRQRSKQACPPGRPASVRSFGDDLQRCGWSRSSMCSTVEDEVKGGMEMLRTTMVLHKAQDQDLRSNLR